MDQGPRSVSKAILTEIEVCFRQDLFQAFVREENRLQKYVPPTKFLQI